jgi:hypothetical protein
MKQAIFSPDTIWCIHSPRSGEYWFVQCPSRSGAKIYLCGNLGPRVDPAKGPFEAWEYRKEDIPPEVPILQATFFPANDPRNWKPDDELKSELQPTDAAACATDGGGDN